MPDILCTCQYCGKEWTRVANFYFDKSKEFCSTCGDKRVKFKEYDNSKRDCFGYASNDPKPDAYIKDEDSYD